MKIGNLLTLLAISSPFYAGAQITQFMPAWHPINSGTTVDLNSVFVRLTGNTAGFAAGDSGVILKSNGIWLQPWSSLNSPTTSDLYTIDFPTLYIGYAAGQSGTLLKTINGGTSWTTRTIGTADVFAIQFLGSDTGWAVGSRGFVAKTVNGGTTWTRPNSGTANDLHSVYFRNASTGFAVGNRGTILTSINGGNSWSGQPSGTLQNLWDVAFTNSIGLAAGDSGTILISRDQGVTWLPEVSRTKARLASINVPDTMDCNIAGENVDLFRYYSSRVTSSWVTAYLPPPASLNSISGSYNFTFAVGQGGKIFQAEYEGGLSPWRFTQEKREGGNYGKFGILFSYGKKGFTNLVNLNGRAMEYFRAYK